jgi:hypothetical protein
MGMESFFVKVFPKDLQIERVNKFMYIVGKDITFNRQWDDEFRGSKLNIQKQKGCFVLDSCIEIHIMENNDKSTYMDLIGCFACYDIAIKKMEIFIEYLSNLTDSKIQVFIFGETYIFREINLTDSIIAGYNEKYNNFKELFPKVEFIVTPSKFYKEYYGIIPRIKRKIIKLFNSYGQGDGGIDHK